MWNAETHGVLKVTSFPGAKKLRWCVRLQDWRWTVRLQTFGTEKFQLIGFFWMDQTPPPKIPSRKPLLRRATRCSFIRTRMLRCASCKLCGDWNLCQFIFAESQVWISSYATFVCKARQTKLETKLYFFSAKCVGFSVCIWNPSIWPGGCLQLLGHLARVCHWAVFSKLLFKQGRCSLIRWWIMINYDKMTGFGCSLVQCRYSCRKLQAQVSKTTRGQWKDRLFLREEARLDKTIREKTSEVSSETFPFEQILEDFNETFPAHQNVTFDQLWSGHHHPVLCSSTRGPGDSHPWGWGLLQKNIGWIGDFRRSHQVGRRLTSSWHQKKPTWTKNCGIQTQKGGL